MGKSWLTFILVFGLCAGLVLAQDEGSGEAEAPAEGGEEAGIYLIILWVIR